MCGCYYCLGVWGAFFLIFLIDSFWVPLCKIDGSLSKMKVSPGWLLFLYIISNQVPSQASPNHLKVKGCIIFVEILKVKIGASRITLEPILRPRRWKREMLDTVLASGWEMHPWTPWLTFAQQYLWPWARGTGTTSNVPSTCLTRTSTLGPEVEIQLSQQTRPRHGFLAEINEVWGSLGNATLDASHPLSSHLCQNMFNWNRSHLTLTIAGGGQNQAQ